MQRRQFLKFGSAFVGGTYVLGSSALPVKALQKAIGSVAMLCWEGYDGIDALKALRANGLELKSQNVSSGNEIIAKLRSGGLGTIDIVTPNLSVMEALIAADLLQPLELGNLPAESDILASLRNMDWNKRDGKLYSVPIAWSDYPIVYRSDLMEDIPESWLDLGHPRYKGRLVCTDTSTGALSIFARAILGNADFRHVTKKQLLEVADAFRPIFANVAAVSPGYGDATDLLARGDAHAIIDGWRFVIPQLKSRGIASGKAHIPKEGTYLWCDSYAIAKDAPNLDGAYAVVNQLISPEGAAAIAVATASGVVNYKAIDHLPDDVRALYPYSDIDNFISKNGFYTSPSLEKNGDTATKGDWEAAWERIKLG